MARMKPESAEFLGHSLSTPDALSGSHLLPWLETLRLMGESLGPQRPFQASLKGLLSMLAKRHHFLRAHLVLFEPETGQLRLSLADTPPSHEHAEYSPGEGVTGQVFATGRPVIVEHMRGHPLFMSRLFERTEADMDTLSFLSVPVLAPLGMSDSPLTAREVVGTLNADTTYISYEDLALRSLFLQVVASLIANEAAYLQEEMARQRRLPPPAAESSFSGLSDSGAERSTTSGQSGSAPFIAQSKVMRHILEQAAHVAQGRTPVLLCGEPGVGKERLASRIHSTSPRRDVPMVVCYCAAIAPERQEAEFCGFQKGAFWGAVQTQKGLFEQAHLGTIFLEAVEALTMEAQAALLRLLEERSVVRLSSNPAGATPVTADVRVIAASSAPLEALVEKGQFSAALLARLSVCTLHIPPLRERREDVIPLAEHALRRHAESSQAPIKRISYPALELLTRYYWPGNISELKSCLLRAAQYCEDQVIRAGDLPPSLQSAESTATEAGLPLGDAVARFEKEMLVDALIKAGGNMLKAARDLKSSYRIVNYKVKKYGIDPHQFTFRKG